jgi:acyl-[acyl carrier protein]--UDP-N-acetylglucosamine O-acyltransferase
VELAPDVEVGPGVIIDGPTKIGAGTRVVPGDKYLVV